MGVRNHADLKQIDCLNLANVPPRLLIYLFLNYNIGRKDLYLIFRKNKKYTVLEDVE
jgi:hypothetical protein